MPVWIAVHYYGGKWLAKEANGQITEIAADTAADLIAAGVPYLEAIGEALGEIGEDIGEAIGELGDITLSVIKGSGIALVEGMSDTYDYVAGQVSPYRVEAVAVVWSMVIYGLTISTVLKRIKNA